VRNTETDPVGLEGFTACSKLLGSSGTRVYSGHQDRSQRPVVFKVLDAEHQTPEAIERLEHEFRLLSQLNFPVAPDAIDLKRTGDRYVSVLSAVAGKTLADGPDRPDATEALTISLAAASALEHLHGLGIFHFNLHPEHIVIGDNGEQVFFLDFQWSWNSRESSPPPGHQTADQRSFPYLPPELLGRLQVPPDQRADLYGLGACLYHWATGSLPFTATDSLELLHSQIARRASPANELNPALPENFARILDKLLAKSPEDRYQSARGLRADLETCLTLPDTDQKSFVVGRQDRFSSLQSEHGLHGREREQRLLRDTYARVRQGGRELLLLGGVAGIGKTSLIEDFRPRVSGTGAVWASGKFDQLARDIPYSAILDAFQKQVRQWLTESDTTLTERARAIRTRLGSNLSLIIDVIPEIGMITGPAPAVEFTTFEETRNRFVRAFLQFMSLFCHKEQPLVLFVDDLQWIDAGSISLIEAMLRDPDLDRLLVIGAYRDDEVPKGHSLHVLVDTVRHAGLPVHQVHLSPLTREDTTQLLMELLNTDRQRVQLLAELLQPKTQGNPFFIEAFVKTLYQRGLLNYNSDQRCWEWDPVAIRQAPITDDIVELIVDHLRELSPFTTRLLTYAACLGAEFDLNTLADFAEVTTGRVRSALSAPMDLGLVTPIQSRDSISGQHFRFAHDRIQQAAYALLEPRERLDTHLALGRFLLAQKGISEDQTLAAVSHMNLALPLIEDSDEKHYLAGLNLRIGHRARNAAAFESAFNYFWSGLELLGDKGWKKDHELWLSLSIAGADAAHLAGRPDALELLFNRIRRHGHSLPDTLRAYEIMMATALEKNDLPKAMDIGFEVLDLLGIRLPRNPGIPHILWHMGRARLALGIRSIESLTHLPAMESRQHLAQMRIFKMLTNTAYWANPNLIPILVAIQLRLTLRHGNSNQAPFTYASYGMLAGGLFNKMNDCYRFGRVALKVHSQYPTRQETPNVLLSVHTFTAHWKTHVRETLPPLLEAQRIGRDVGNPAFASYGAWAFCINSFHSGKELNTLAREIAAHSDIMLKDRQITTYYGNELYHQTVLNLLGRSEDPCRLAGERYNEDEMLPVHEQAADLTEKFVLFANKLILCYLFRRHEEALELAKMARPFKDSALGTFSIPVFVFYETLARIACLPDRKGREKRRLYGKARKGMGQLRLWARHAPDNHGNKYWLVRAEMQRWKKPHSEKALVFYYQSIELARRNGFIQEEALALECCARYYAGVKSESNWLARMLMLQAQRMYRKWGATAKVSALYQEFPDLPGVEELRSPGSGGYNNTDKLDFHALRKSLSLLAREKVQSRIIEKTLLTAVEFAGAESGVLLLPPLDDTDMVVEGEYAVEDGVARLMKAVPFRECERLIPGVIQFVQRSRETLVIADAQAIQDDLPGLHQDPDVVQRRVRSVLCMPIEVDTDRQDRVSALLYMENNLAPGVFTRERMEVLEVIGLAAASTLELSREAATDGLTGLYNHRYFKELLNKEVSQAQRHERPLSLIMLDIDHFKGFNDRWGHQAGDLVLARVAQTVRESARGSDIVARYGGEELAIILPETHIDGARQAANNMRRAIEDLRVTVDGEPLSVTASLGVATLTRDILDAPELISHADKALYQAKEKGRNRVVEAPGGDQPL